MFLISGRLNSTITHRLIAMFLRFPQFHITETTTHRFSVTKAEASEEGSDEGKKGWKYLSHKRHQVDVKWIMGEDGVTSNNKLDK